MTIRLSSRARKTETGAGPQFLLKTVADDLRGHRFFTFPFNADSAAIFVFRLAGIGIRFALFPFYAEIRFFPGSGRRKSDGDILLLLKCSDAG